MASHTLTPARARGFGRLRYNEHGTTCVQYIVLIKMCYYSSMSSYYLHDIVISEQDHQQLCVGQYGKFTNSCVG